MTDGHSWDERAASGLSGPELCAYASRLIGSDPRLVLWGGGNSSVKTVSHGERVVWVKGSGADMKTIGPEGFSPLKLDALDALRSRSSMSDDEMLAAQSAALASERAPRPSIETLLHAWTPATHVYHTHADDVAGFTCAPKSRARTRKAFGADVLWVPYVRPGFDLSKRVAEAITRRPKAWGLVLDKHGALTWGDTAREAYERMITLSREAGRDVRLPGDRPELSEKPARLVGSHAQRRTAARRIAGWLQGDLAKPSVVRWCGAPEVLRFLARPEAAALTQRGPFTMEHALHTKARPLVWRGGSKEDLSKAVAAFKRRHQAYRAAYAPKAPAVDPSPRVLLVPGIGLFAAGRDSKAALVTEEIYRHTIEVIARVSSFTRYSPLGLKALAGVEFWELEMRKIKGLAPIRSSVPAGAR
ncbi:MAG: class II aldolase/adducin family protein [Elusimicrobia bacterium]|nr:class II aldolase/adducin family protein [Elusimicrobiota bacterium]